MTRTADRQIHPASDALIGSPNREFAALQARASGAEKLAGHQALLVAMLAELLSSHSLEGALDALAGALKSRFNCDRVAIALSKDGDLSLRAVSQQAVIEPTSSEARLLVDAMHEACLQESVVCWPQETDTLGVLVAHRALAGRRQSCTICSVPMYDKQQLVGAFLLERQKRQTFSIPTLERLSVCIAPLLTLYTKSDRSWWQVLLASLRNYVERYFGADRPGMRVLFAMAVIILFGSMTLSMHWQIVAPAELLSHDRRLVTAPQTGFISKVLVSAGDRVSEGQLVAQLDRREVALEATSRDSDIALAEAEFRAAMASYDPQATGIARARLAQARARREGVEQRLSRTELLSPINGLVIASDPMHTQGASVTRGETLFEIAPNEDFDVHVLVDEADVYDVFEGQIGVLTLRAMPGQELPIIVDSVQPVAEAGDGKNRFRVLAALSDPADILRPGQSGIARLEVDRMSILSVLTRRINRSLAQLWWRWLG